MFDRRIDPSLALAEKSEVPEHGGVVERSFGDSPAGPWVDGDKTPLRRKEERRSAAKSRRRRTFEQADVRVYNFAARHDGEQGHRQLAGSVADDRDGAVWKDRQAANDAIAGVWREL